MALNFMLRFLIVSVALIVAGCAAPQQRPVDLKAELEAMFDSDQRYRPRAQEIEVKGDPNSAEVRELKRKQKVIDDANLARLGHIIKEQGWPDQRIVGEKAAMAAFMVIQHNDFSHQKQYLPLLRTAVAEGKARGQDLALLEDRVLVGEKKKQIYGSQLQRNEKGGLEFCPIEDEEHVDERRKSVGLKPLADYGKQFGIEYKPK
jgi:hypothetical protein